MPVKRSLFQTPTRVSKRRKTTSSKKTSLMKIPRSLLPEVKHYTQSISFTTTTHTAYQSVSNTVLQGDDSDDYVGSKFRMLRLRCFYDFTGGTLSEGVRMCVVIPKDPTTAPSIGSAVQPWDNTSYTVLHDMLLPNDKSVLAGTFDVTGPINVEMNLTSSVVQRNNIFVYLYSQNAAGVIGDITNFRYEMWFTDA